MASLYYYRTWKRLADDDEGIPFTREENDAHLRGVGRESLMYILRDRKVSEAQRQEMMDRKNRYYMI